MQENCQLQHSQECLSDHNAGKLTPLLSLHLPASAHPLQTQLPTEKEKRKKHKAKKQYIKGIIDSNTPNFHLFQNTPNFGGDRF